MIKWVLRRAIDKVERDWNYDASHMRDMIDANPRTAWLFSRVTALGPCRACKRVVMGGPPLMFDHGRVPVLTNVAERTA